MRVKIIYTDDTLDVVQVIEDTTEYIGYRMPSNCYRPNAKVRNIEIVSE